MTKITASKPDSDHNSAIIEISLWQVVRLTCIVSFQTHRLVYMPPSHNTLSDHHKNTS